MLANVRMGELKVADTLGDELAVVGLGSCIALALCDSEAPVAGLAHVVLSTSPGGGSDQPGKYADTAVPALLAAVLGAGARRRRLRAVLIGGARMFATGLDIGARNAEAVTAALTSAGIPISATDVGGIRGRTARVQVGGEVTSQMAGLERNVLLVLGRAVLA
ncbi:chemotaxis protein CheD [Conexibacter sp. DBS9H8]|uniref:chemotaxis protein CheD n=1 Tax=Conexibacter sp. DBS9H8 TaxID=2937801 RepID=UPI00200C291D|nr:chemotaxis protein CheD [Conexibacter sp. DBS9H8]